VRDWIRESRVGVVRRVLAMSFVCASGLLAQDTSSRTAAPMLRAQGQPIDSAYTARLRQLTPVDPRYTSLTDLVDHLPASATVPTPLRVLGYVPGTVGRLAKVADLNRYFHALAAASPRVRLFSLGRSDEGRESIVVAIADDSVIARLGDYRHMLGRLSDPRDLDPATRYRLVHDARPIYWLTGSIHSTESGSPEMLMELAYRLAVDESEYVRGIRSNVITLITPTLEPDGRDREVDAFTLSQSLGLGPIGIPLIYWGKYIGHDNNRDGMVVSQRLTRNVLRGELYWHPTIVHDLHESGNFLYVANDADTAGALSDAPTLDQKLVQQEISELTRRGLPGVWTQGSIGGWSPTYTATSIADMHNGIGRLYETFTSYGAGCSNAVVSPENQTVEPYRPHPAINGVRWCIRSNINYQESGVLVALRYVADHRAGFVDYYASRGAEVVRRGRTSPPYAYVIPHDQRHAEDAADLVNLFRLQGIEVGEAASDYVVRGESAKALPGDTSSAHFSATNVRIHRGDWTVRMDQPFANFVRATLGVETYRSSADAYDDTGWTLDLLRHVVAIGVGDSTILSKPARLLTANVVITGSVPDSASVLLIPHLGDWRSATIPWRVAPARVAVAESPFVVAGRQYDAGTFVVRHPDETTRSVLRTAGVHAFADDLPGSVRTHVIALPRIALLHSWIETQNEGWVRYCFDTMHIPYTYISSQQVHLPGELDAFDVVVFPHVGTDVATLINGQPMIGPAVPWEHTPTTPSLGIIDHTPDMRPELGYDGLVALQHFVQRGGLLIAEGQTSSMLIDAGLIPSVDVVPSHELRATGGVYRARVSDPNSPIAYGYAAPTFPVYFDHDPLLDPVESEPGMLDGTIDSTLLVARHRMAARVVVQFVASKDSLLLSGQLAGGEEMAGIGAVLDAPQGRGHVVLFGIRPMWRWETQGSFALVINAIANWNALSGKSTR
jgi:hypothetical protein